MNEVAVIHNDGRGLWTVDLFRDNKFVENIGGSSPKSRYCQIDAGQKWGNSVKVKVVRIVSVQAIEEWLCSRESEQV